MQILVHLCLHNQIPDLGLKRRQFGEVQLVATPPSLLPGVM